MNFRSSTYMPVNRLDAKSTLWCEAHQAKDGSYRVITIVGTPGEIARPGFFSRLFKRMPDYLPNSVPSTYALSIGAPTACEALKQIFDWEKQQCKNGAKLLDIGDADPWLFGGINHYVVHIAHGRLVGPAYPAELRQAVSSFISGMGIRYLFGLVSRSMHQAAADMAPLYAKLPSDLTSAER